MMLAFRLVILTLISAIIVPVFAASAIDSNISFANAAQYEEYNRLIDVIRCPTCQDENIANSNSPLAQQLRQLIGSQIKAGKSQKEIEVYLIDRYGDFITYKPRLQSKTLFLWLGPLFIMLFVAAIWAVFKCRKPSIGELSEAESAQLDLWLKRYRSHS